MTALLDAREQTFLHHLGNRAAEYEEHRRELHAFVDDAARMFAEDEPAERWKSAQRVSKGAHRVANAEAMWRKVRAGFEGKRDGGGSA